MLSGNQPVTMISWRLAEGYPLTSSANVLKTFRKLSIVPFWERYLLTLSGLSATVLLTLFCWVGVSHRETFVRTALTIVHILEYVRVWCVCGVCACESY